MQLSRGRKWHELIGGFGKLQLLINYGISRPFHEHEAGLSPRTHVNFPLLHRRLRCIAHYSHNGVKVLKLADVILWQFAEDFLILVAWLCNLKLVSEFNLHYVSDMLLPT